jgi:lambda family phage portal protein
MGLKGYLDRMRLKLAGAVMGRDLAKDISAAVHEAARRGRLEKDWPITGYSADGAVVGDTLPINARTRSAVRDYGTGAAGAIALRRTVVGTGITAKSSARHPETDEALRDYNRARDWSFTRWARNPRRCDLEHKRTLLGHQRTWINDYGIAGQSFCIPSVVRTDGVRHLTLQTFEVEQLAWDLWTGPNDAANGNRILGGIEVNDYGAPVAYHVYTGRHPMDSLSRSPERIPAERVLHFFDAARARQTHGVSLFAPILLKMWHTKQMDLYELVRARLQSCIGAAITRDPGITDDIGLFGQAGATTVDANNNRKIVFEPAMVIDNLRDNEKVEMFESKGQPVSYELFNRAQKQEIAAGLGFAEFEITRDYNRVAYSASKLAKNDTYDETDPIQILMADTMLRPIMEQWTVLEILLGRLEAPEFFASEVWAAAYQEHEWRGPAKRPADEVKFWAAKKLALETGGTSLKAVCNELGEDYEDVLRQLADEKKLCKALGITLVHQGGGQPTNPAEPRPTRSPDGTDDKDDDGGDPAVDEEDQEAYRVLRRAVGDQVARLALEREPEPEAEAVAAD